MVLRRKFNIFYVAAILIFGVTSILPVGHMLAQFVIRLLKRPSEVANVLVDMRQLVLLGHSMIIASSATLVAFGLGLPVAIIIAARDLPLRRLFHLLILIPMLIPPYVMAGAWIHLFSPSGLINRTLASVFGSSVKVNIFTKPGCAWCLGISFFPLVAIILAAGLSQVDSNLQDIARISTNRRGVVWHSILPQIIPHLLASICLVMIFVLAQYGVPSLLGINTYPVEIFAQFSVFYDANAAVATALPLVGLVVFLILLQQQIMRNHDYVCITPSSSSSNPIHLRKLKNWAAIYMIIIFIVVIIVPFSSVLGRAQGLAGILSTLSSFSDSIVTTSILALLTAVAATAIAFPIGQRLAHGGGGFLKILDAICWLPIAIPGTIVGIGFVNVSNWIPILQKADSFGILLLCAYIGMFSAFSIRIFEATYRRADPYVSEAAAIDCRRWYRRLLCIEIPIHSKAITASTIVVFVLAMGELNATVLLIPPGRESLGISIDNLLHYGANATASALCLIEASLVIIVITFGLVAWSVAKRIFT